MSEEIKNIIKKYQSEYDELEPFFDYLKARLTLDFSRLIRKSGLNGKLFFTVRIKSFVSVANKLRRRKLRLTSHKKLFDLIKDSNSPLADVVGIRFICLEERTIVQLIHHLLHHNSIRMRPMVYYQSIINFTPDHPLAKFVEGIGFKKGHLDSDSRTFRRYEDLNMYLYFQNVRDISSQIQFLPHHLEEPQGLHEELDDLHRGYINEKRKKLEKSQKRWIRHVADFPIEGQIVSFAMHLFNETQRPEYLARKDFGVATPQSISNQTRIHLESMKHALASATQSVEGVAEIYGGPFSYRAPINLVTNFNIASRIPTVTNTKLVNKLKALNNEAAKVAEDSSHLPGFIESLDDLDEILGKKIGLLLDRYPEDKEKPKMAKFFINKSDVEYWLINRLVLMMHAIVAGYSSNENCVAAVRERIGFEHKADGAAVMLRIYESISDFDKIFEFQHKEDKDVLKFVIDPLVKWRQATAYYQLEDYANAARQARIGVKLIDRRVTFALPVDASLYPARAEFLRREIEYDWTEHWRRGDFNPNLVSHLIERLASISSEPSNKHSNKHSRDRICAYQCLLGFQGLIVLGPETIDYDSGKINKPFEAHFAKTFVQAIKCFRDFEREQNTKNQDHPLWWNIASCIAHLFYGDLQGALNANEKAQKRFSTVTWHPRTRLDLYRWILDRTTAICQSVALRNAYGVKLTKQKLTADSAKTKAVVPKEAQYALLKLSRRFEDGQHAAIKTLEQAGALKWITGLRSDIDTVVACQNSVEFLIKAISLK